MVKRRGRRTRAEVRRSAEDRRRAERLSLAFRAEHGLTVAEERCYRFVMASLPVDDPDSVTKALRIARGTR